MRKLVLICLLMLTAVVGSCSFVKNEILQSEWDRQVEQQLVAHGIAKIYSNLKYNYTTNRGIKVKSTVPIPQEFLNLADEAAELQVSRFSLMFPEWTWKEIAGRHMIVIDPNAIPVFGGDGTPVRCQSLVDEPGAPCIWVKGVKAAGLTIGWSPRMDELTKMPPIVLPHQQQEQWRFRDWWKNTAHNEFEHVSGWKNLTYNPTGVFYHFIGPNDQHPWTWGDSLLEGERKAVEVESIIHPIQ